MVVAFLMLVIDLIIIFAIFGFRDGSHVDKHGDSFVTVDSDDDDDFFQL